MERFILRLENKSYVGLIKDGKNEKVIETNIHYAFPFDSDDVAREYAEAINNKTKVDNKLIHSQYKVVEIIELTTKVKSRQKI